jgi:hypothetical protein
VDAEFQIDLRRPTAIELLDNFGREHLMQWADSQRNLGIWGSPG